MNCPEPVERARKGEAWEALPSTTIGQARRLAAPPVPNSHQFRLMHVAHAGRPVRRGVRPLQFADLVTTTVVIGTRAIASRVVVGTVRTVMPPVIARLLVRQSRSGQAANGRHGRGFTQAGEQDEAKSG